MIPALAAVGALLAPASASTATAAAASASGPSFDQMLIQAAQEAANTMRDGEAAAIEGVKGSMPTFKVVESVMAAQRTLQDTLAIRDKAVSAYQEITKMTI